MRLLSETGSLSLYLVDLSFFTCHYDDDSSFNTDPNKCAIFDSQKRRALDSLLSQQYRSLAPNTCLVKAALEHSNVALSRHEKLCVVNLGKEVEDEKVQWVVNCRLPTQHTLLLQLDYQPCR